MPAAPPALTIRGRYARLNAEVCGGTLLEGAGPGYDGSTAGHPVRVEVDGR